MSKQIFLILSIFFILLTQGIIANSQSSNNQPPNCSQAAALPSRLWPPDHQFYDIILTGIYDPDGDEIRLQIIGIMQNEPIADLFSGDSGPDAFIEPLKIKSERWDHGNGRQYIIKFKALDSKGGICAGEAVVCIPLAENSVCASKSTSPQGYISTKKAITQYSSSDIKTYEELINSINPEISSITELANINEKNNKRLFSNSPPDCLNAYPSLKRIYPPDGTFQSINILGINDPENDLITELLT